MTHTNNGGSEQADNEHQALLLLTSSPGAEREAQALFRKLHWKIVSVCFALVFLCFVDRTNLGLAADGFCADLKISSVVYGTGVGLFFVGYAVFQIPSNIIIEHVGAPAWLGIMMITWGVSASAMAFVRNPAGFYFTRFVLGLAEAGAFPGIWYYFTLFFPENRIILPVAITELGVTLSQVLSAPIAAAFLTLDGVLGIAGWKWLFFLEGLAPIALGAYIWSSMPRNPAQAKFLTENEREWLKREIRRVRDDRGLSVDSPSLLQQVKDCVSNTSLWATTAIKFFRDLTADVTLFWTPLLLQTMWNEQSLRRGEDTGGSCSASGSSSDSSGANFALMTSIPYGVAAVMGITNSWHSQWVGERRYHIALMYMISGLIFATLPVAAGLNFALAVFALTAGAAGSQGAQGPLLSFAASCSSPSCKAMGVAMFNTFSNIGGFVGPFFTGILVRKYGTYTPAILLLAANLFLAGVIPLLMVDPLLRKKKKLERMATEVDEESVRATNNELTKA